MKLSILLATYNGEKYLSAQLDSLLSQSYSDFVIYISDDYSTDGTQNVINDYAAKYPDKIIDLNNKEHFGCAKKNFFNLVDKVDSDIYMFCDQDDVWLPNKIEDTLRIYNNLSAADKKKPVLVHTDLKVVDGELNIINRSFFDHMQMKRNVSNWQNYTVQNYVTGCTMLINKPLADLYKLNKQFLNADNILMHDYFFAFLASLLGRVEFLDEATMLYRQHGNNSVGAKDVRSVKYALNKLKLSTKNNSEIVNGQLQTAEILKLLNESNCDSEIIKILTEYSELSKKSKIQKLSFIKKHKLLKFGFKRRIFQFLTI